MEKTCAECKHYIHHYGLLDGKIYRIYCGHCTHSRVKAKKPDEEACGNFEQGAQGEETFADKEYLSKRLLEYVLRLDILPNIEDYQAK